MRAALPELPTARAERLVRQYGLMPADAQILVGERALADYFEAAAEHTDFPTLLVHLLLSDLLRYCKQDPFSSPVVGARLGELAELLGRRTVNSATAKKLLAKLRAEDFSPAETVRQEGLEQICDEDRIAALVTRAVEELPRAVADYHGGKKAALQALLGKIMAYSRGLADPEICERLLLQRLKREE